MTVQKTITEGISELLYNNDYVVMPDFGGFVTRHEFSHFSLNKGLLHPPAKKVVFNVQLKQNDGILATWLKDKIHCDFAQANKHLDEFAVYCKMLLNTKRRMEFEKLGVFYLDFENNICFEPKADVNFLIESFGLSSIALKEIPLEIEVKPLLETKDRFEKVEVAEQTLVKKRNYKRIAALAIGLPIAATALLFAVNLIKPNTQFISAILGNENKTVNYFPVDYNADLKEISLPLAPSYVVDASGYASVNLFDNEKTTVVNVYAAAPDKKNKTTAKYITPSSVTGNYQVVVGCFAVIENASRLVTNLKKENINAGISGVNPKGLHVVSCGGFNDKDSATALLQNLKAKFPSAWIMAK